MKFYSTNNKSMRASLREAVLNGLAPDGGLYMPEFIPQLPGDFFKTIKQRTPEAIAAEVAGALLSGDIERDKLEEITSETINFPLPLVRVQDDIYALELFHGPTLAFKDVGARFMARMLAYLRKNEAQDIIVLVATSGDTGSAVAHGFLGVKGVKVIILYPSGKVSDIQEKQLTTLGENITALEIKGSFDDCQRLVKQAFSDNTLKEKITLTSANSINIARLIPQSFYYFTSYAQLPDNGKPVVFCVPSGNFGNLTAGLIAKKMGLPINRFIAATNENDIVPQYLKTGIFSPRASRQTISNAMDVGNPSNFARMTDLYHHEPAAMKQDITGERFSDTETKAVMKKVFDNTGYVLDPHGAVAFAALEKYSTENDCTGVFLETAHPAKFSEVTEQVIGRKIEIPERLAACLSKPKKALLMEDNYESFRDYLQDTAR